MLRKKGRGQKIWQGRVTRNTHFLLILGLTTVAAICIPEVLTCPKITATIAVPCHYCCSIEICI